MDLLTTRYAENLSGVLSCYDSPVLQQVRVADRVRGGGSADA